MSLLKFICNSMSGRIYTGSKEAEMQYDQLVESRYPRTALKLFLNAISIFSLISPAHQPVALSTGP
ncbi:hypothetical protein LMG31884_11600 [Xanthomonas hydrangeae]|nr:hypothetical protein LMG31884_11600 [Xanthomonas hydrangeae]CAD7714511.1 hypothetical protein LMG31884_11600 [Xanthomonas hydrangeae]CAD7724063.1 hypothetical protein LMG31887_11600 [Xanthomonas hydrangeae]CAD7724067.1 hypothetical protein LMG31887_11600 [Xanthomonas hydrangeae]